MSGPTKSGLVEALEGIGHSDFFADIFRDDEGTSQLEAIVNRPDLSVLQGMLGDPNADPLKGSEPIWPFTYRKSPLTKREQEIIEILQKKHDKRGVTLTAINEVLSTTKRVWQICYEVEGDKKRHYTWLFEANKDHLRQEFYIMMIANKAGIPTGNIDRHMMNLVEAPKYGFVIVDESPHTVSSYYDLLKDLRRSPERMQQCANIVASLLAKVHVKLSAAENDFERYGIDIPHESAVREVYSTFLAGLHKTEVKYRSDEWFLLQGFKELAGKTHNPLVISHGDVHGNNIRSAKGEVITNEDQFRLLDWGTLRWANPYSDLMDHWLHHQRYAISVTEGPYKPGFGSVERSHFATSDKQCDIRGVEPRPFVDPYDRMFFFVEKNVCEIVDPLRPAGKESMCKGQFHLYYSLRGLGHMIKMGIQEAGQIDYFLRKMCREVPFLKPIADLKM